MNNGSFLYDPRTPAPSIPQLVDTHPHSYAVTAEEAWLCKRYQEEWQVSRQDNSEAGEHW